MPLIQTYQRYVFLVGPLLGGMLPAGLAALARRAGALVWTVAVAMIVVPIATVDFDYRYVLPAIPFACLAAALGAERGAELLGRRLRSDAVADLEAAVAQAAGELDVHLGGGAAPGRAVGGAAPVGRDAVEVDGRAGG